MTKSGAGGYGYQSNPSPLQNSAFPTIGVISKPPVTSMISATATSLGIKAIELSASTLKSQSEGIHQYSLIWCEEGSLVDSALNTLESAGLRIFPSSRMINSRRALHLSGGAAEYSLIVARSAHNQAATWSPTKLGFSSGILTGTITPAPELSSKIMAKAQAKALTYAASLALIGVMSFRFDVIEDEIVARDIVFGPGRDGFWTLEGAYTSHIEQHIRAILDLPLGETSPKAAHTVVGAFHKGEKSDLYRPYLHLMARTPALKFYQYAEQLLAGDIAGHISISGENLDFLRNEVLHAVGYMSGEVDE